MKWLSNFPIHLNFLLGTILPFFLDVKAETTMGSLMTTIQSLADTSRPLTTPRTEDTTDTTQVTTIKSTSSGEPTTLGTIVPTETTASQFPSLDTSTSPPLPTTLPPEMPPSSHTVTSTDQGLQSVEMDQTDVKACEEDNKRVLLICLIIIGVLIFIGLCLLLTVVVLASKLAYLKRKPSSRRLPRTNGDFLSASSLWPAGLETLQRVNSETLGTGPRMQNPGTENLTAGKAKSSEDTSKKLASEISDRQKQKEEPAKDTSAKPCNVLITDIEI